MIEGIVANILTIGYTGRKFEEFLAILQARGVTHLVDVRTAPYSRFSESYNQAELEDSLKQSGIKYVFIGNLLGGRPNDPDCYDDDGRVVYSKVASKEYFQKGIGQLLNGTKAVGRVLCLMCSELRPEQCHRSKLIGQALQEKNVNVLHIDEREFLVDQATVMSRVDSGQMKLFDEYSTSRKTYRHNPYE
jgi:uncharacterized protein (DUF488 family)